MNTRLFMASEPAATSHAQLRVQADLFAEISFVAFLLLIFVGLKPFAMRDMSLLPLGDSGNGAGDVWRQVCYLGTFTAIVFCAWRRDGARVFSAVPFLLAALLLWCVATGLWAQTPAIAIRRAGLETVIAISAMLSVQMLGVERSLTLLRSVLGCILVVNFVSIAVVHQAIHLSDESDKQLIGNWRGLYFHKNIAGAVTALTAILFIFRAMETRRVAHWLLFTAAVFFTIMTRSKTSLGLLPIALLSAIVFRSTRPQSLERWIVLIAGGLVLALATLSLIVDQHAIERLLTDPTEFTGRVAIWQAEFAFVRDHPLLGAGFGSFADTGALSPLYDYVTDKWVQGEAHGHNAYLQLLVTIGGVGFVLAMLALVVQPALAFRRIEARQEVVLFTPLFALFVFVVLHNFVESDFLEGDSPVWVGFLLMVGCLHARQAAQLQPLRAPALAWSAP
jgi:exopolysaccharide production protein ExoQ